MKEGRRAAWRAFHLAAGALLLTVIAANVQATSQCFRWWMSESWGWNSGNLYKPEDVCNALLAQLQGNDDHMNAYLDYRPGTYTYRNISMTTEPHNVWPSMKCQVHYELFANGEWIQGGAYPSPISYFTDPACKVFACATPPPKSQCGPDCNGVADPISPSTGGMYTTEVDIESGVGGLGFARYYNSIDTDEAGDLSAGWRHSFSRRIEPRVAGQEYLPYLPQPDYSSLYNDEAAACTGGFAEIKSRVASWANATSSYSDGLCKLSVGGTSIGALPLLYQSQPTPAPQTTVIGYDVVRDSGQVIRFSIQAGALVPPAGTTLRLQQTTGGFELTDAADSVETYDNDGNLLSIRRRSGIVHTLTYDGAGRLSAVADSFGHSIGLAYDGQGRLNQVTAPDLHTLQYAFDTAGRLFTATNTDGSVRTYVYENASFPNALTGLIDESHERYSTWTYDAQGRANHTSEAGGAGAMSLAYNTDGSVTTTDALGAVRTFDFGRYGDRNSVTGISGSQCPTCREQAATTYDGAGFVSSRTDYNGNVTCYATDPARGLEVARVAGFAPGSACPANLAGYTPASGTRQRKVTTTWNSTYRVPMSITGQGRTTSFTYDTTGNMLTRTITDTSVTPGTERTWTYTYNAFGKVLTEDGPRADVSDLTTYTYYNCTSGTQCGQVQTVTNALGQVTTFNTYNAYGLPLTIIDANSAITTLTYDARQRLTASETAGEVTSMSYWPTGQLKRLTLPDGSYLDFTYDDAHRLTQITDGEGNRTVYTLDAMGNHTSESTYDPSNALSRTRTLVFNTLSQLSRHIGSAGTQAVTTAFTYDNNGNQKSVSAPLARNGMHAFDELNRLHQITDPASGVTTLEYDATDNLVSVTDPRSLQTSYTYNGFGDLTGLSSPDTGATLKTYDSAGNVHTSIDARNVTGTYGYDALNRLTSIAFSDAALSFTYDAGSNGVGRLTGASDANHSVSWGYDAVGRVISKSQSTGGVTRTSGYGYTNGNLTSIVTPSGQTVAYGYTTGRVTSVAVNGATLLNGILYEPFGPIRQWTWGDGSYAVRTFEQDGNVAQIDSGGEFYTYDYDDALRVTNITNTSSSSQSWSYGYDSLDRLTYGTSPARNETWTYDANGNRLTQTSSTPGTVSSTLAIDPVRNRVLSVSGSHSSTYGYDTAGNINAESNPGRLVSLASTTTTSYKYNALSQRIAKSVDSVVTYFVYDEAGHLLGEYTGTGALIQETVWLGDIPVATLRPKAGGGVDVYYVHTDHLNTPRKVTRPSDGVLMWRWDPAPFGDTLPSENPQAAGAFSYNLRMPGQYYDSESGLHYNYFRNFDPGTGRYVQADPIGLRGGINVYAYVGSNPLDAIDPFGLAIYRGPGNYYSDIPPSGTCERAVMMGDYVVEWVPCDSGASNTDPGDCGQSADDYYGHDGWPRTPQGNDAAENGPSRERPSLLSGAFSLGGTMSYFQGFGCTATGGGGTAGSSGYAGCGVGFGGFSARPQWQGSLSTGDPTGVGVRANLGLGAFGGSGSFSVYLTTTGAVATVSVGPGRGGTANLTGGYRMRSP